MAFLPHNCLEYRKSSEGSFENITSQYTLSQQQTLTETGTTEGQDTQTQTEQFCQ